MTVQTALNLALPTMLSAAVLYYLDAVETG